MRRIRKAVLAVKVFSRPSLYPLSLSLILVLWLSLPSCSLAADRLERLAVLGSLAAIDYDQSVNGFFGSDTPRREINPILGPEPERRELAAFGMAGLALLAILPELMPEPVSTILLDSIIASEQFNIEENRRVELGQGRTIHAIPVIVSIRF